MKHKNALDKIDEISGALADDEFLNGGEDDQSWFLSEEWQTRRAEALKDVAEGRVVEFDAVENLIADTQHLIP